MIIEIPDVDVEALTLDELKEHNAICSDAQNKLRAYCINVCFLIIKRNREQYGQTMPADAMSGTKLSTRARTKQAKRPTRSAKDILGDDSVEDLYSIDDFR